MQYEFKKKKRKKLDVWYPCFAWWPIKLNKWNNEINSRPWVWLVKIEKMFFKGYASDGPFTYPKIFTTFRRATD